MHDLPRYAFGDFHLDTGRVQLLGEGGVPIPLEPKAFGVLRLLAERAPQVVDKAEIFAIVWKDTAVTDNALTRVIAQLRKALGDDAKDPRYIATVSARGYRLLPAVGTAPADITAWVPPTPGPVARRRGRILAWGIVLFTIAVTAAWLVMLRRETPLYRHHSLDDLDLAVAASARPQQLTIAKGFDGYVAYSPDGTSIAYASDRSGSLEIYVEGLADGATAMALTHGGGPYVQPAWSPDGRFIAYHDLAAHGIWLVPSRGGAARKVVDVGARPAWSPDGRYIAFQSRSPADHYPGGSYGADSTLWIVEPFGSAPPRRLTQPGQPVGSHGMPQWWPGSSRIVFAVTAPAAAFLGAALWTVDASGGDLQLLKASERLSSDFAVPLDGRGVLVIARTTALWWLPVANDGNGRLTAGEPRPTALPVTGGPLIGGLAISPDSRRIAWTASAPSSSLVAVSTEPGASREPTAIVPSADIGGRAGNPTVSAAGRIAFIGNRGNGGNKIFLVVPDQSPRQLTNDAREHHSPQWLEGQDALAVLSDHGDGPAWWHLDPATGRERLLFRVADIQRPAGVQTQVLGPALGMAISPDFTRLAVAYVRDGVSNLWTGTIGPKGPGPLVQRTFETTGGAFGSWSRDGRWLAYQCTRGGDTQLCVVEGDGTQAPRQLTTASGTNFIGEWIDDDTLLFAGKYRGVWNVQQVSRTTGVVSPITTFTEPRYYVRYPRWDPAKRRVLFERNEMAGRLFSVQLPVVNEAGLPGRAEPR